MIKFFLALSLFGATVANASELSTSEVKNNFKVCSEHSEGWYGRFGQYAVSFDRKAAVEVCNKQHGYGGFHAFAREMGCKVNGVRLTAGYYCQELGN